MRPRPSLDHFTPELQAIAVLSQRYNMDLRSVHQAGIASQICAPPTGDQHGQDPIRVGPRPASGTPHPARCGGRGTRAAAWYDRLTSEAFPMVVPKGATHPRPVVPEPQEPIDIGGMPAERRLRWTPFGGSAGPAPDRRLSTRSTRPTSRVSIPT